MLMAPATLGLDEQQLGLSHTSYLIGAIVEALLFGYLTYKLGRKFTSSGPCSPPCRGTSGSSPCSASSPGWRLAGLCWAAAFIFASATASAGYRR
jgi:hypothetical protein